MLQAKDKPPKETPEKKVEVDSERYSDYNVDLPPPSQIVPDVD